MDRLSMAILILVLIIVVVAGVYTIRPEKKYAEIKPLVAVGHWRTFRTAIVMSAFLPKADSGAAQINVR